MMPWPTGSGLGRNIRSWDLKVPLYSIILSLKTHQTLTTKRTYLKVFSLKNILNITHSHQLRDPLRDTLRRPDVRLLGVLFLLQYILQMHACYITLKQHGHLMSPLKNDILVLKI